MVELGLVLPAPDQRIELDACLLERRELPGGSDEHPGRAALVQGLGVAADEEDGVHPRELAPGQPAVARRVGRSFSLRTVIVRSPVSSTYVKARRVGSVSGIALTSTPRLAQLRAGTAPELVGPERREERAGAGEPRQLHGRDGARLPRAPPRSRARGRSRPDSGTVADPDELDPLDVPDDGDPHGGILTPGPPASVSRCRG